MNWFSASAAIKKTERLNSAGMAGKILLIVTCTLGCTSQRFSEAFEQLPAESISIPLHSNLDFDQEGGHLQGVQLHSQNARNYVYFSAG